MTDPPSFRNESFRLIMDKSQAKLSFWNDKALPFRNDGWCTFRNDRSHFEMIRPLSFRNDGMLFSSIWRMTVSSKYRWPSFWNEDKGLLALCLLSEWQSYLLSFKNDLLRKWPSFRNDNNRKTLSKLCHFKRIDDFYSFLIDLIK